MAATPEEMTDGERDALVRAALAGLGRGTLRAALQEAGAPRLPIPTPAANALATLRRHRDPASVIDRPQYRAALPYAVAVVSQECLEAVVDALGDHADDPTAEQLEAALDAVAPTFDDATVRVMLASVAIDEMPASGLCLALLDGDGRYGLGEWRSGAAPVEAAGPSAGPGPAGASEEVRAERRARKQREAEERRKQAEDRARAVAQVREARKQGRTTAAPSAAAPVVPSAEPVPTAATRRRPVLSPAHAAAFDGDDPLVGSVVLAWVPFGGPDPDHPDLEGKDRPCVVVAGGADRLLVRPCYSEGGVRSRDWTSTALGGWRQAGLDKATWVATEAVVVDRPVDPPLGRLTTGDWNALW